MSVLWPALARQRYRNRRRLSLRQFRSRLLQWQHMKPPPVFPHPKDAPPQEWTPEELAKGQRLEARLKQAQQQHRAHPVKPTSSSQAATPTADDTKSKN